MHTIHILTHRGLDPSKEAYFAESSREAFEDQLLRGYGLEFDLRPDFTIGHDQGSRRNIEQRAPVTLQELLERIHTAGALSALHLKRAVQDPTLLDMLAGQDLSGVIIFDVTLETARYLKEKNPALMLAPSVAHPYDVERYGRAVGGTLYTLDKVLEHKDLFDWVWLDEWDRADKNSKIKKLYTRDTFDACRAAGFRIALVMPELHATSPGLLGGESHEDARAPEVLEARWREILSLGPDAVCTDYPDQVRAIADL
jgi:hypothetical protein